MNIVQGLAALQELFPGCTLDLGLDEETARALHALSQGKNDTLEDIRKNADRAGIWVEFRGAKLTAYCRR